MKNRYYLLTGSKNNAGDYLIGYRAIHLLKQLRPEVELKKLNGWEPINQQQLQEINDSKALILTGGPSLRFNMQPGIYPLTDNLNDIKVPVITFGIGWKSPVGEWHSTHNYPLNKPTLELLKKINSSPYFSSVRDYRTLNVLFSHGFKNFVMTGCPALYQPDYINKDFNPPDKIENIAFSLGVSFTKSKSMENMMKNLILKLREYFKNKKFIVVFHHSLDNNLPDYQKIKWFQKKHLAFADWLKSQSIPFLDISKNEDNLLNFYKNSDLHIGFRVHAHLYMCSINKPSILIAEDGRGKALKDFLSGLIFDGFNYCRRSKIQLFINKFLFTLDPFRPNNNLPEDLITNLDYEIKNNYPRIKLIRKSIDSHYQEMARFIRQLP